jgi:hypothetical protein
MQDIKELAVHLCLSVSFLPPALTSELSLLSLASFPIALTPEDQL